MGRDSLVRRVKSRGTQYGYNHTCTRCLKDIVKGEVHVVATTPNLEARDGHQYRMSERFHEACWTPEMQRTLYEDPYGMGPWPRLMERLEQESYEEGQ